MFRFKTVWNYLGKISFITPDHNSLHVSTTPTPGAKAEIARVGTARAVWNPQPHRMIADWLWLMESVRGES